MLELVDFAVAILALILGLRWPLTGIRGRTVREFQLVGTVLRVLRFSESNPPAEAGGSFDTLA